MLDLQRRAQRRRRRRLITGSAILIAIAAVLGAGVLYLVAGSESQPVVLGSATGSSEASTTSTTRSTRPPTTVATSSAFQATTVSTVAPSTTSTDPPPQPVLAFDPAQAMAHIEKLASDIGVRRGGTEAEMMAAQYAVDHLSGLGYAIRVADVPVPNGLMSHNVIAVKKGSSPLTIVIGGHIDSKTPSPGGNDNASGSATVLELARDLYGATIVPTVIFVLFGNEEMIDDIEDHHHYGSRDYVQKMTAGDRANLVAMISLDMIGYGDTFTVRTMDQGSPLLHEMLQAHARASGVKLTFLKDPSPFGYSDHEPFESAGFPAAWLEWREDPVYHTTGDTYEHCSEARIQEAGDLVLGFLAGLVVSDLEELQAAKN